METPDLSAPVQWARKKLCPWKKARKAAIRLRRDGRNTGWICAAMQVDRQWLDKWWNRWRHGGKTWDALDDRSRRPHRIHTKRHAFVGEILAAKINYPYMGAKKIRVVAQIPLSHDTIHRVLRDHEWAKVRKKRWTKLRRFRRPFPNYLWQFDFKVFHLADGREAWAANLIDDHSRFLLASKVFPGQPTTGDALAVVFGAIRMWGKPLQVLTDRGGQFHQENSDAPSFFTLALDKLDIRHIKARPRHPRTCGKIERWHGSLNREWFAYQDQPTTYWDAQRLMDRWVEHYNTVRPHQALKYQLPVEVFATGLSITEDLVRAVNEVI
jgi:transposase InsO family protein